MQINPPPIEPTGELRKIIVNATSEMLDEPGEGGIYQTTRFYDRLEKEITEYMNGPRLVPDPMFELILETVKNSAYLSINLQNVIAKYLDYQSAPRVVMPGTFPKVEL